MTSPASRRALFLDRDGIVNREQGYVWRPQDFVFEPDFFRLADAFTAADYHLVIITNQGGLGQGLYTWADVEILHSLLRDELRRRSLPQPLILACPHHPTTSRCLCRKPLSLWFERALALGGYSAHDSWMLGDRVRDLIPAKALGMNTALVHTHTDETVPPGVADHVFASLTPAADFLLSRLGAAS